MRLPARLVVYTALIAGRPLVLYRQSHAGGPVPMEMPPAPIVMFAALMSSLLSALLFVSLVHINLQGSP